MQAKTVQAVLLLTPRHADPARLHGALEAAAVPGTRLFEVFHGAPDLGGTWTSAVEVDGPDPDAVAAAASAVRAAAGEELDPERSMVVAGDRAVLFGDPGAVQIFFTLFRRDGTSHQEFVDHWRDVHATFVRPGGDRRAYVQLYADLDATADLTAVLGFAAHEVDGIAMPSFDTPEALQSALTTNFDPDEAEDLAAFTEADQGRGAALRRV
ncbi:MAG TPA: EthD domain-containing protein [Acidimicrobiales bacterium]|nr:EthD domain-containing protein [Acidimicrobiales bacterium]